MTYIETLQKAYYDGEPLISNEEYDAIARLLGEESIGHAGDIKHHKRMWSLDKKYLCRGDELPLDIASYVETPKLDGCAVDALYLNGNYVRGLTRGDGIQGSDITEKLRELVPAKIRTCNDQGDDLGVTQITGEVATTITVDNWRNFASGALNQKDIGAFKDKIVEGGLVFVAYTVETDKAPLSLSYVEDMKNLAHEGFLTTLPLDETSQDVLDLIPTDGIVYRKVDNEDYYAMGETAKFRKGAFAVKEDEEGVWTTLTDVTWNVGKSGKVVPTAIFEAIEIDGATITRATLNNPDYMNALGIKYKGQRVSVIRAGGIIPRIIGSEPLERK